ncbi:MAG: CDP-alcohol phosphatidyltransferase family protein [Planctomycetes bacterium]|nr:CDP-alcohol phosphatidyltransferase family protein [Planctomycetota bacterium]
MPERHPAIPRWLPNAISVLRILLVPVWGLCAEASRSAFLAEDSAGTDTWRTAALAVLITIGVSDVVDGFLARRFGLASHAGATLDAVADKLAQVGLLLFFTVRGAPAFPATPLWFLIVIFGRDVLLGIGWLVLRRRMRGAEIEVVHKLHGKLASVLLFLLLVLLTAAVSAAWTEPLLWGITVIVVASTLDYVRAGFRQARRQ